MVYDPQGRNPKIRPVVIVTQTPEINATDPFAVVAVTGEFSDPLEDHEIALTYHSTGSACTGLKKPSVANCRWQEIITEADIVEDRGRRVTTRELAEILEQLKEIEQEPEPPQT